MEKPDETIFIRPLRLDDCELPRRLRSWHYVDFFPAEGRNRAFQRLLQSLMVRHNQLGSLENVLKKGEAIGSASPSSREEVENPPEMPVIADRTESLTSAQPGILDLAASILPIFYFILAGSFVLGLDSNAMQFVWGIIAILAGIIFVLKRQIVPGVAFKISLILFLVVHTIVSYSNDSGLNLSVITVILEGILAWLIAGLWIANFRSMRIPAQYSSIVFGVFLIRVGAKLIFNLYNNNTFPTGMYTLINISAVLSSFSFLLDQ